MDWSFVEYVGGSIGGKKDSRAEIMHTSAKANSEIRNYVPLGH